MAWFNHRLKKIWRLIPVKNKSAYISKLLVPIAPKPTKLGDCVTGPITVAGLLNSTSGLGESARLCANTLKNAGFHVQEYDICGMFANGDMPQCDFGKEKRRRLETGGTLLLHINPPYLPFVSLLAGARVVKNRKIIGYWHWELPRIPDYWLDSEKFVHEVWTSSEYTARALREKISVPVKVIMHPVNVQRKSTKSRKDLKIPNEKFVVLSMFHAGSNFERKNPLAVVKAFKMAFGDNMDAQLILKVADADRLPGVQKKLEDEIGANKNIRLFYEKLSNDDLFSLIDCADVICSLHRAEGFGMVPAQAMLMGKPVVATAWSGNMDFMNQQNSFLVNYRLVSVEEKQGSYDGVTGQKWAEPDIKEAAQILSNLYLDPELRKKIGNEAKRTANEMFAPEKYVCDAVGSFI